MARIRTIKPEFPQSESMGRISRDARLLFIQMWTIADDSGRLRGNSRMLASLLFPYDDDAPGLIDQWIGELESESCVVRYVAGGQTYIQVCNWLIHQKIDKPSQSKIPPFDESSRILANPRECSSLDQGRDQGEEGIGEPPLTPPPDGDGGEKPKRERKPRVSLKTFIAKCVEAGEKPISEYRPLQEYVQATGLPMEFVQLCWQVFKAEFLPPGAKAARLQADWRRHFLTFVEKGYYRLWFAKADGSFELTTAGLQAKSFHGHREAA